MKRPWRRSARRLRDELMPSKGRLPASRGLVFSLEQPCISTPVPNRLTCRMPNGILLASKIAGPERKLNRWQHLFFWLTAGRVPAVLQSRTESRPTRARRQGRIAQLGERFPYKEEVTGSSPVSPTREVLKYIVQSTKTKTAASVRQTGSSISVF